MSFVSGMRCLERVEDARTSLNAWRNRAFSTLNDPSSCSGCMRCYSTFLVSLAGTALLTDCLPWYLLDRHAASQCTQSRVVRELCASDVIEMKYWWRCTTAFPQAPVHLSRAGTCEWRLHLPQSLVLSLPSCRYKVSRVYVVPLFIDAVQYGMLTSLHIEFLCFEPRTLKSSTALLPSSRTHTSSILVTSVA